MAPPSDKSRGLAFALALVLGWAGGHRFYVGKTGTGCLMLCTAGGLGIWYLYDLITVAAGAFTDTDGRPLRYWDPESASPPELSGEILEELDTLRREVSELAERVDFTERLLTRGRSPQDAS